MYYAKKEKGRQEEQQEVDEDLKKDEHLACVAMAKRMLAHNFSLEERRVRNTERPFRVAQSLLNPILCHRQVIRQFF